MHTSLRFIVASGRCHLANVIGQQRYVQPPQTPRQWKDPYNPSNVRPHSLRKRWQKTDSAPKMDGKVSLSSSRSSVAKAPTIHRRLRVRAFTGRFRALLRTEGHDNEGSIRRKDRLEEPLIETASERRGSTSVSSRGASLRNVLSRSRCRWRLRSIEVSITRTSSAFAATSKTPKTFTFF